MCTLVLPSDQGGKCVLWFYHQIKVYRIHPEDQRKMEVRLEIHKDKTLAEATAMVHKVCVSLSLSLCLSSL